jgi:K+-transporting ATPase ATPase A chain
VSLAGWLQAVLFLAVLIAITPPLGGYMASVYQGRRTFLTPVLGPVEGLVLRLLGTSRDAQQDWKGYARSLLIFSGLFWLALYLILRLQPGPAPADVTFNTASSFLTNTNWQFYAGETTLTNVSQMVGLAVQNFVSAAVGMAVAVALIRAIAARSGATIGAFWVDLTRGLVFVLLPLSFVLALVFVSQGVTQTLSSEHLGATVGPVASQEAIKLLGTNGGGFFNVNSAHPFENPNALTNFLQLLAILAIPAALTATFGRMVGSRRQGWAVFAAMAVLFAVGVVVVSLAEGAGSPAQDLAGVAGGNLEGKELRNGVAGSSLFAVVTTVASCGAVNAAMESLTGIGASIPLANMMTGEVVFGGVGSGLYGMLLFVLLAVFLAGLMVGRTPEYLGKKLEAREIKLVAVGTLGVPLLVLLCTAVAIGSKYGDPSIYNGGPQGFAETLYAYVSQANNNGSAFAGYTGFVQPDGVNAGSFGITFADLLGGLAMLAGRFLPMLAVLAVAGSLVGKRVAPAGPGTFRTDTATFVALLIGAVLLVALLTFVPALLLGPVVQGLTTQLF